MSRQIISTTRADGTRSTYALQPGSTVPMQLEALKPLKPSKIKADRRTYPKYKPGMSTAEYVAAYEAGNNSGMSCADFWQPLNTAPAAGYVGIDTVEHGGLDQITDDAPALQVVAELAPVAVALPAAPTPAPCSGDAPAGSVRAMMGLHGVDAEEAAQLTAAGFKRSRAKRDHIGQWFMNATAHSRRFEVFKMAGVFCGSCHTTTGRRNGWDIARGPDLSQVLASMAAQHPGLIAAATAPTPAPVAANVATAPTPAPCAGGAPAADPAMVAELVAGHEASEAGAASLDRLATADSEYAARQPWDTWGRSAYAAQRAADCRAAAAQIRAALATPTPAADPAPADAAALACNLGSLRAMHAELSAELLRLQRSNERGAGAMARRLRERLESVDAAASMTARRLSEAAPTPAHPRMAESLALLAKVANARSASAADEQAFKAAGLVRDDGRGWLSLTPAGRDALQAGGYRFHPAAGCGWMLAEPVADEPAAGPVPTARDGVEDRAARLAALLVGIIGADPARLAPALRRESARVAAAAESVPGRISDGYRRTARALADMATAEHARAAPDRYTLAPDAPRPDPAALVAELDQITAAARDRMGGRTGSELSAMTPAELARRHAILQQLPTFAEERQAARQRIAARLAARQARPASARAAPPADGWRTIAARPAPAGAFAGFAVQAPGAPCSDIGAAAMLPAAAPAGWRWRPDAPVWRGLQPAGAFAALIGAAGGTRCSDIGADINPAARRGHHVENLECQISQPTPPAAPSSSFRTAWSSRPLSCCVTQQAGRLTSTLHRSWPSVPPAGLTPGCSLTAQKTTPPDCWPRGTRSTWRQVARVMPSWTISSAKRRQKISSAAVSATSRDGPEALGRTRSARPAGVAARFRHVLGCRGPSPVATSAHWCGAVGAR